jgi:Mg-chelatase subunit ChlD
MMLEYTCSGGNSTCNITGLDTRARAIDLGEDGGLDVLFVFDASSSIKKREFKRAKQFAIQIVNQLGATWK